MKVKYGFFYSDQIKLNFKDIFLLLIGRRISSGTAIILRLYGKDKKLEGGSATVK